MKRILIGIPSLQEADSIAHVTSVVDEGLRRTFNPNDCLIVNIDSASTDGTADVFLATPTESAKHAVQPNRQPAGKGTNVLAFLRLCEQERVSAAALIDADVTSITPDWVPKLLQPVLNEDAGMVFPLYLRSRFDGATTNLFAYPLLHASLLSDIRQPLAGDFGLSPGLIRQALAAPAPTSVLGYGIDVFLTVQALSSGRKTVQTPLGRKLHKPSHPKRDRIFSQVAASLLEALRSLAASRDLPLHRSPSQPVPATSPLCIDEEPPDAQSPQLSAEVETSRLQIKQLLGAGSGWFGSLKPDVEKVAQGADLHDQLWCRLLASWLRRGLAQPTSSSLAHAKELLPFYYLRMQSFWREIANHAPHDVEMLITTSAQRLRHELSNSYNS